MKVMDSLLERWLGLGLLQLRGRAWMSSTRKRIMRLRPAGHVCFSLKTHGNRIFGLALPFVREKHDA